jgi:hypothetical protein
MKPLTTLCCMLAGAGLWAGAGAAWAEAATCVNGAADKQLLAAKLLAQAGVTPFFLNTLPAPADIRLGALSLEQRALADEDLCPKTAGANGYPGCSDDDANAIQTAQGAMIGLLASHAAVRPGGARVVGVADFFLTPDARLGCDAFPQDAAQEPGLPALPVRIRSNPDDLLYSQADPLFAGLTGATVSVQGDEIAGSTTETLTGYLGFPLPLKTRRFQVIPYAGINRVRNAGGDAAAPPSTSPNTADVGAAVSFGWTGFFGAASPTDTRRHLGNWVTLRPDYLRDWSDHSTLTTLNLVYTPIASDMRTFGLPLNSFARVGAMWVAPILDLRLSSGWYLDRGDVPSNRRDFVRVGTRLGLSLAAHSKAIPLTVTVTDTLLHALRGAPGNLHYLDAEVALPFTSDQNLAVALSFQQGRQSDTADEVRTWSIGLSAKY